MNAIDRLILSNSSKISIRVFPSPLGGTIFLSFPHIPSECTLKPVNQALQIPGFWEHTMSNGAKKIIEVPKTYDAIEVAKAICKEWENSKINFEFSSHASPGVIQGATFKFVN